jgi:hypothetical protein
MLTKKHNDQLQNQHKQQKMTTHAQKHNTKKNKTQEKNNTFVFVVIFTPIFIRSGLNICSTKQYMACYLQGLMLQHTHNKISCIRNHGSILWLSKRGHVVTKQREESIITA